MLGKVINERYKIIKKLGKGGMAIVYEAQDKLLDRRVAIKMLRPEYVNDIDFIKKFRHEAKAVARISHPNVVNIYDIGQDGDNHYLVMEDIEGDNLKEIINKNGVLEIVEALDIAKQICSALVVAHDNNIIHCDIKPHNILINHEKQVKVTDFGIARAVTSATMTITDTIVGSAHYFSPEQARGGEIKTYSDLYSLGIVLYEMLTGEVPFTGETPISVALKHIQETPAAPSKLNQSIPQDVEKLVMKAIAKKTEDRFNNAGEMREAINNIIKRLTDNNKLSGIDNKDVFNVSDNDKTKVIKKIKLSGKEFKNKKRGDSEYLVSPKKSRRSIPVWIRWVVGLLILFIIVSIGGYIAYKSYMDVPVVEVPDLIGMEYDEARREAAQVGLHIDEQMEVSHPEIEEGKIISQYPLGGERIRQTMKIQVTISKGAAKLEVPELTSLTEREAEVLLENERLSFGEVEYIYSNVVPKGQIIRQTPPAGEEVLLDEEIDILVSRGIRPEDVIVPNVIGLNKEEAEEIIEENKLIVGEIEEKQTTRFMVDQVAEQFASGGTETVAGSEINLVVSSGLKNEQNASIFTAHIRNIAIYDFPPEQRIRIIVNDNNGQDVVYDRIHHPGDRFEPLTINSVGPTSYEVYWNGENIASYYQDEDGMIRLEDN